MTTEQTSFQVVMQQIRSAPLWIKQAIYVELRHDLESVVAKSTLDAFGPDDMLPLHIPRLSRQGERDQMLQTSGGPPTEELSVLLSMAQRERSVIDICMMQQWTLEQCALILCEAIDRGLIEQPKSGIIQGTVLYLAGKIRLGEYLVKIERLSVEQLDQALRTQRYILEAMGKRTGIANVLINLGYINKQDTEGILFLKEESKKTFEGFTSSVTPQASSSS